MVQSDMMMLRPLVNSGGMANLGSGGGGNKFVAPPPLPTVKMLFRNGFTFKMVSMANIIAYTIRFLL